MLSKLTIVIAIIAAIWVSLLYAYNKGFNKGYDYHKQEVALLTQKVVNTSLANTEVLCNVSNKAKERITKVDSQIDDCVRFRSFKYRTNCMHTGD